MFTSKQTFEVSGNPELDEWIRDRFMKNGWNYNHGDFIALESTWYSPIEKEVTITAVGLVTKQDILYMYMKDKGSLPQGYELPRYGEQIQPV